MSTGFERRVERLRKQVLSHQVEEFKPAEESIIDLSKMKVDDLKDLLDKGFKDRDLYLSFREQYLQLEPKCFCDFILKDLLAEGKEGYELLQSFQEKQVLVAKGYKLVYEKGSE